MAIKSAMVRARVETGLKDKAESVFFKLGLNATDAITIFYSQVALKKAIPFVLDLEANDSPDHYRTIHSKKDLRALLKLN